MSKIKLIENFLSWQGEGPDSGRQMVILRFKRCSRIEKVEDVIFAILK